MARTCPDCDTPRAISVCFSAEGNFLFPCVRCGWVPVVMPGGAEIRANRPCPTYGCPGSTADVFTFGGLGSLDAVRSEACMACYAGRRAPYAAPPPPDRTLVQSPFGHPAYLPRTRL
ncbi:hypothetical protein [Streptomyces avicenniae]|uniref:hypothetical protein n=1 Tax=Streptomyces avicenniae TaxID=500153 RepID=UPI00069C2477|nr:hypothetical protein [Streptomyces avicenniae]